MTSDQILHCFHLGAEDDSSLDDTTQESGKGNRAGYIPCAWMAQMAVQMMLRQNESEYLEKAQHSKGFVGIVHLGE